MLNSGANFQDLKNSEAKKVGLSKVRVEAAFYKYVF